MADDLDIGRVVRNRSGEGFPDVGVLDRLLHRHVRFSSVKLGGRSIAALGTLANRRHIGEDYVIKNPPIDSAHCARPQADQATACARERRRMR
jgi:hypothetical protein